MKLTYRDILAPLCIEAGKAIMAVYEEGRMVVDYKADDSPLTEADRRAHEVIASGLNSTGLPVLSEEGRAIPFEERKNWQELWIVDPLDGTKEFIKRNGEFTVNIARIRNGKAVEGYIYAPVPDKLYFGEQGKGAWLLEEASKQLISLHGVENGFGKARHLPLNNNDQVFRIVASRSHLSEETHRYIDRLKQEYPNLESTSIGSSLKICLVATGEANVYPRFAPTMEWDTAAGHAILKGAGKNLYTYPDGSKEMRYNRKDLLNPWFIAR